MQRPDLYDVLSALRSGHPCHTIALRHRLVERFDFPTCLQTNLVLRRLKRLEKIGKVARVPSAYSTWFCWTVIGNGARANDERALREDPKGLSPQDASVIGEAEAPDPHPSSFQGSDHVER